MIAAGLWLGWVLLKIEAASRQVTWQTDDQSLTLVYFPLKDQTYLAVGAGYAKGKRKWLVTDYGATRWLIASIELPDPEELFMDAWIRRPASKQESDYDANPDPRFGLTYSSPDGLVKYSDEAAELQQLNLVDMLDWECQQSGSCCGAYRTVIENLNAVKQD